MRHPAWLLLASCALHIGVATASADHRFYSIRRLTEVPGFPQGSLNSLSGSMDFVTDQGHAAGQFAFGSWYFDGVSTRQMGFRGPQFDDWTGWTRTYIRDIRGPYVSGETHTLTTGENHPWFWSGGVTTPIAGLTDAVHASPSATVGADGTIAGTNRRYAGNADNGMSVWVTRGGVTEVIGLIDGPYTASNGFRQSYIHRFTADSAVLGISMRYGPGGSSQTAWVWAEGALSIVPGPEGPAYVNSAGHYTTLAVLRNSAGDVVGTKRRYAPGTDQIRGEAAFLQRAGTTVRLGLTDALHTATDGTQLTDGLQLFADGTVLGVSRRYPVSGTIPSGQSSWVYRDGETTLLGLTGPGFYDSSSRSARHAVSIVGPDGALYGTSLRSTPGGGEAAWRFADGVTVELGVAGEHYQSPSGGRWNGVHKAVPTGVLGSVFRYNGPDIDRVYWWRDGATGQYTVFPPILSSAGASDMFVGDSDQQGRTLVARMTYQQWEPLVTRAALFIPGAGLIDLEGRVLGGYDGLGLKTLASLDGYGRWQSRVLAGGDRIFLVGLDVDNNRVPLLLERVPCPADVGSTGGEQSADGLLNSNDFVVFIDMFFRRDTFADVGSTGALVGSDGAFNNNDFVVFIDLFFDGC
ncbi:MAG TPA: GC-type dockerin domain-anchored protein [Phycisphaerales bacterium]|nr:GC-type dockerin domain-anchored protein [Phycisphaerales bacterium]